jgi:hypothetical protein
MRTCQVCGLEQGLDQFRHNDRTCKSCRAKQKRDRKQRYKQQLKDYKKSLCCSKCGINDHRVLEFHHKDPVTKEATVASLIKDRSFKSVLKEIEKCVVLCANCHRIEHSNGN